MSEFFVVHSNVIIAGLGLLGILATAFVAVGKLYVARLELSVAERELSFQAQALSFGAFLIDWEGTSLAMKELLDNTAVDRIMIFRAWNGTSAPKWTTAVYQMREVGQEPIQYIHTELDSDYVERIHRTVDRGMIAFSVKDAPASLIKNVYDAEGVTASCWGYIDRQKVAASDAVSISYISFSSHTVDSFDQATITKCRLLTDRLRGLAITFNTTAG